MLQAKRSRCSIRTTTARSRDTPGRRTVSGSPGRARRKMGCRVSISIHSRTSNRPLSLIAGMALAKQSSATTGNLCCSAPRAISSRPLATKNLQTCIAICSAFISAHWAKRPRTRSPRRATKSGKLKNNDKRKKQRKRKRKSRKKRRSARSGKKIKKDYAIIDEPKDKLETNDHEHKIEDLDTQLDRHSEWNQIYFECWRQMRDFFFSPTMNGVDWKALRDKYAALLPFVNHRNDLTYLLGELIAELNNGHTYVAGC